MEPPSSALKWGSNEKHTAIPRRTLVIGLIVGVLILIGVMSIIVVNTNRRTEKDERMLTLLKRENEVREEAKKAVLDNLKSPLTAVFDADVYLLQAKAHPEFYVVWGVVHAHNSHGGLIKSHYLVMLRDIGTSWFVERVAISADWHSYEMRSLRVSFKWHSQTPEEREAEIVENSKRYKGSLFDHGFVPDDFVLIGKK